MLNFIKRNIKLVIVTGVSFVLIAGLTTALIITNVGTGQARGRDRDRSSARVMTQEQIEERIQSRRERLDQRLADGSITQDEYDTRLAALEGGVHYGRASDFSARDGMRRGSNDGSRERGSERMPLTEEQLAEKLEAYREKLAEQLANGEITQAEYDEKIEAIENGEFPFRDRNRANKSESKDTGEAPATN